MNNCSSGDDDGNASDFDTNLQCLNNTLESLNQSPVIKRNVIRAKKYPVQKLDRASKALKESFDSVVKPTDTTSKTNTYEEAGVEIINQLKEKFETCQDANEKVRILSVLPKSWSIRKFKVCNLDYTCFLFLNII